MDLRVTGVGAESVWPIPHSASFTKSSLSANFYLIEDHSFVWIMGELVYLWP